MLRLRQILRKRWTLLAICDERGECQVAAFIDTLAHAERDRRRYLEAKRRNEIEIIEEEG